MTGRSERGEENIERGSSYPTPDSDVNGSDLLMNVNALSRLLGVLAIWGAGSNMPR